MSDVVNQKASVVEVYGSDDYGGMTNSEHGFYFGYERTLCPHPVVENTVGNQALSHHFVEWMMGFPEGWVTDVIDRRPALKALGNAVVPQVAERVFAQLRKSGPDRNGG